MAQQFLFLALLAPCVTDRVTAYRHNVLAHQAHSSKVTAGALPPGFEDELYCPPGYCRAAKQVEFMSGPRSAFWECQDEAGEKDAEPVKPWGSEVEDAEAVKEELLADNYHSKECASDEEDVDEAGDGDEEDTGSSPKTLPEDGPEESVNFDEDMEEDDTASGLSMPQSPKSQTEDFEDVDAGVNDEEDTHEDTGASEDIDEIDESGTNTEDVDESGSQWNPKGPKGTKITMEGFPEDLDGVHRGALNGVYFEDVSGDCDVQGHPTYWQKETDSGDTPFIYYCGSNSTTKLLHKKWAISSKKSWGKVKDGKCETFAPFPPKKDLAADLHIEFLHKGFAEDGKDKGWAAEGDKALGEMKLEEIRIASIEPIDPADEVPSGNCA